MSKQVSRYHSTDICIVSVLYIFQLLIQITELISSYLQRRLNACLSSGFTRIKALVKMLSESAFTSILSKDLYKSTPPVSTEESEQLAITNQTRPLLGWVLIAITPSAKRGLAT